MSSLAHSAEKNRELAVYLYLYLFSAECNKIGTCMCGAKGGKK